MSRRVYIETSVVSYLTARPSNDVIKSACQQITQLWWNSGRAAVSSYISPYVVEEASAGDPTAAAKRIEILRTIAVLQITPKIPDLTEFLLLGGGLPPKARIDALHIACAAYHEIDTRLVHK
jgi:predicted nucleic acid-binding protein